MFSLIFIIKSFKDKFNKSTFAFLGITLFLFGISDIIEVQTGACFKPFGLFLLKAGCIASMIFFFSKYYIKKSSAHKSAETGE